jgi:hypothetical protein
MAYIPKQEKSPFEALLQPDGTQAPAPAAGSAGTPFPSAAPPSSGTPSGSFTSFSRLATANEGNGQQTAQGLSNMATGQVQKAQTGLASAQTAYQQGAQNGTVQWQPAAGYTPPPGQGTYTPPADTSPATRGLFGSALTRVGGPPHAPTPAYVVPPSPYNDTAGAQSTVNSHYAGPMNITDNNPAWVDANKAGSTADDTLKNLGSTTGLQALLQQQHGGVGGYSNGASKFDAMLAQRAGGNELAAAANQRSALQDAFAKASEDTSPTTNAQTASTDAINSAKQYLTDSGDWDNAQKTAKDTAEQADAARVAEDRKLFDLYKHQKSFVNSNDSFADWKARRDSGYSDYLKNAGIAPMGYDEWKTRQDPGYQQYLHSHGGIQPLSYADWKTRQPGQPTPFAGLSNYFGNKQKVS